MDAFSKPNAIRPEVAPLYEISFILCGLFFCSRCHVFPVRDTGAPETSDLHYYRLAEWAHDRGWLPDNSDDYSVLCGRCAAQHGAAFGTTVTEGIRRFAGGLGGAVVGTLAYWLMLQLNIHIPAVVGAATALGVSAAARTTRTAWGLLTAVLAVGLSLLVEFLFLPFAADTSLSYFVTHVADLPRNSLLSLAAAAVLGFYFGRGRRRPEATPPRA